MRTIHLHGKLSQYGESYRLDVASPLEALRALCLQINGLAEDIKEGAYRIVLGDLRNGRNLTEDELSLTGSSKPIHIVPVVAGAGRGGKVILGVALVAMAVVAPFATGAAAAGIGLGGAMSLPAFGLATGITYGSIAAFGTMMAISGVANMLSPQPKTSGAKMADDAPSFLFNNMENVTGQGNCIPVIYGFRVRVGSVVASAGYSAEDYAR